MRTRIEEAMDFREVECKQVLHDLIEARPAPFDQVLPSSLPKTHGLYAISMIGAPEGEFLHVGKTKNGRSGLLGRVWEQHYQTGGASGDLLEKVKRELKAKGCLGSARDAREYIRQNCQVQWVVVEDDALRSWTEHYILALLQPIWCS